ncbi:hypothetical protein ACLOJK_034504 [Asimina triloba]
MAAKAAEGRVWRVGGRSMVEFVWCEKERQGRERGELGGIEGTSGVGFGLCHNGFWVVLQKVLLKKEWKQ